MYVCTHIYRVMYKHVLTFRCASKRMCYICLYTHTHIHTHTYTDIHMYVYIHMYVVMSTHILTFRCLSVREHAAAHTCAGESGSAENRSG